MQAFFYTLLGAVLGGGAAVGMVLLFKKWQERRVRTALSQVLLLVTLPPQEDEERQEEGSGELERFSKLLQGIVRGEGEVVFEAAVPYVGEEIHFYLSVPRKRKEVTIRQIEGIYPGAQIQEVHDDYTIFNPHGAHEGVFLKQKKEFVLPLQIPEGGGTDAMDAILGGFSHVNEAGEGAAFQLVVRRAKKGDAKTVRRTLSGLRKGKSLKQAMQKKSKLSSLPSLKDTFYPSEDDKKPEKEDNSVDQDIVAAVEEKAKSPLFEVNVRVVASAGSNFQAKDIVDGIEAGFAQLTHPAGNELKAPKPKRMRKLLHEFIFREFSDKESMRLTAREIAAMYHFPLRITSAPRLKWLSSKEVPPPPELPTEGTLLGESEFRGQKRNVYLAPEDRMRHIYMIGQTGTGKSTLISNMVVNDIHQGKGVGVVDPHGDLVDDILRHIPDDRYDDVIHFDPGQLENPVGLNLLEHDLNRPEQKTFIANEIQSIFDNLFPPETMGPMFQLYMKNSVLLLMEDMKHEPATLIEVPRIFTDPDFRNRKLERANNPTVVDFWKKEAEKAGGDLSLQNMTPYITSKFNNFIANDYVRPIIGQAQSSFRFNELMDEGKILLVNLSKGRIGDINAGLLGMVITGKILLAALGRVDMPKEERRDFFLYIDEFQNFTTDSISTILSEARKYRLSLTMAHQFIAQLRDEIRDAVFGNVGTQISFRVSTQDAETLEPQFAPRFSASDIMNIDNFYAYVKLLIGGTTSDPFNMHTFPLPPGDEVVAQRVMELSRQKYGKDRSAIEEEIHRRLRE